jgi:catechol-2,3-dioxygenase
MGHIIELGHTGIMVNDLAVCRDFYATVLSLTVTDEDDERGLVFLSSRPDVEHHELVLQRGRDLDQPSTVQQISWRVGSLEALQEYHAKFVENNVTIDRVVTHGNALGVYFFDPEGNRNEVYVQTGREVRQPFARPIDVDQGVSSVLAESQRLVDEYENA